MYLVNSDVAMNGYCGVLEFLRRKHDLRDLWLQQYGAEAHTSRISLAILQRIFPGQLGCPRGDMGSALPWFKHVWFFLSGYFEYKAFENHPYTIKGLKQKITEKIVAIPSETGRKSYVNFRGRLKQCINADGRHLKDVVL